MEGGSGIIVNYENAAMVHGPLPKLQWTGKSPLNNTHTDICIYIYIWMVQRCYAPPAPPPPPPTPWCPPLPPCGSLWCGFPPPLPPAVAVGCNGYRWLGVRLLRVWT